MATQITAKTPPAMSSVQAVNQGTLNAAPASPGAGYVQAEAVAVREMVVDLRQILINAGLAS
jgi:hypothetical protein